MQVWQSPHIEQTSPVQFSLSSYQKLKASLLVYKCLELDATYLFYNDEGPLQMPTFLKDVCMFPNVPHICYAHGKSG